MKSVFVALLILVMVLSVMQLNVSRANPFTDSTPVPALAILSPYPSSERCYSNASVPIKFGVLLQNNSVSRAYAPKVSYSLDYGEKITLTNLTKGEHWAKEYPLKPPLSFTVSATLYNLTEGNHTLSAYSFDETGKVLSTEIEFMVDSFYKSPEVTLISPKKINYTTSQVELIFSTNKEYRDARYLLDYHLNPSARYIFINGNTTLTNLTNGVHKIMLFVNCIDEYNKYGSSQFQGTSFNVSINEDTTNAVGTPEAQNDTPIDYQPIFLTAAAFSIVIPCVVIGYSKKRKDRLLLMGKH